MHSIVHGIRQFSILIILSGVIFKYLKHVSISGKIHSPHKIIVCFKYIRGQLKYELPYNFGIEFAFVHVETRTTMFTYFGILASVKREKVDLK